MKLIQLTQNKTAIVDDEDFELINQWKWCVDSDGYAIRFIRRKNKCHLKICMHRLINSTPKGSLTDHINRNRLDNRRKNLRTVNTKQNSLNRVFSDEKPKGVYKSSKHSWRARILIDGKNIEIGSFDCPQKAAAAYNQKAKELFGEYAA